MGIRGRGNFYHRGPSKGNPSERDSRHPLPWAAVNRQIQMLLQASLQEHFNPSVSSRIRDECLLLQLIPSVPCSPFQSSLQVLCRSSVVKNPTSVLFPPKLAEFATFASGESLLRHPGFQEIKIRVEEPGDLFFAHAKRRAFLRAGNENAASNRMAGEKANQGRGRLSLLPGRVSSLIAGLPIRGIKGGINF